MNKNILFFFSSTVVGGAETNILKISREFTNQGYKVFWCYLLDDGPLLNYLDFQLSGKLETGLFYKTPVKFYRNYDKFVRENKIDVVLNFGLRVEIISRLISKKCGIRKIISNIRSTDDWRKWYHTALDRLTMRSVDLWVSNSYAGKKVFQLREKIAENKIKVIYNFWDDNVKGRITDVYNPDTILRFGVLANITKEKGYFDLITLSRKLTKLEIKHKFIYAGVDKLNGAFNLAVTENKLEDSFEFLGYIEDKTSFFENIDLFLLPSYLEGMPTVILEAMSFGKPVVASNVGGIPELITNNVNGLLCKPGDIDCFSKSIISITKDKASGFNRENKKILLEFSKDNVMKDWIDIIS